MRGEPVGFFALIAVSLLVVLALALAFAAWMQDRKSKDDAKVTDITTRPPRNAA